MKISTNKRYLLLALLLVMACGLWGMRTAAQSLWRTDRNIIMNDLVDTPLIVQGLQDAPRLGDTLKWWSGAWVMGDSYPFYRPLTSLIWWAEYQVFGMDGLQGFMSIHLLSHLVVLAIAFLFLRELLGLKRATLSVCIFGTHIPLLFFGLPASEYSLYMWKDDPEMWSAIVCLLALWSFLKFLRTDNRRWSVGTALWFLVGITLKENVYVVPLLLPLLIWYEKKLERWRWVVPFFIIAIVAFAFRWWALDGWGFRFGTNGSWLQRWFIYVVGGTFGAELTRGGTVPLAVASGIAALFWGVTGKSRWWQVALAALSGASLFYGGRGLDGPAYYLLVGSVRPWFVGCYLLMFLILVSRFLINRHRGQIFGWLWVVITYVPLMTAPITQHALYIVALGWSIWFAYALLDIYALAARGISDGHYKPVRLPRPIAE